MLNSGLHEFERTIRVFSKYLGKKKAERESFRAQESNLPDISKLGQNRMVLMKSEVETNHGPRNWVGFRMIVVGTFLAFALAAVPLRVAMLKYGDRDELVSTLLKHTQGSLVLQVPRGTIYDRNGKELAISVKAVSLYANPREIDDPGSTARKLAWILRVPARMLRKKMKSGKAFVWLKRQLCKSETEKIMKLNLKGIHFKQEYARVYPFGKLAGQVLGFVGVDGRGLEGVELSYDPFLRRKGEKFSVLWDALRVPIAKAPIPGADLSGDSLKLTIDYQIQYLAEESLKDAVEKFEAENGEVVVMEPRTGEILAMAIYPQFDPNMFRSASPELWRNRCITDTFEPGSTFKVILFAAALERGIIKPTDRINCENGCIRIAGHAIHDAHPHRWLTAADVFKVSSNIGAVKVARSFDKDAFYRYIKAFGFGSKTGIDLPGEAAGSLRSSNEWTSVDLAAMSFGQGLSVTALQMVTALAEIANDGKKVVPHVMKEIISGDGEVVRVYKARDRSRVIESATASILTHLLEGVVQEGGTGWRASIEGYHVAGKTGTSQAYDPEKGSYSNRKGTASFVGFVPSDEPKFVIGVFIHNPKKGRYGGVISCPVFREVGQQALLCWGILPDSKLAQRSNQLSCNLVSYGAHR